MEVLVDDHVLVFDIPVRDTHAMKVMYGFDDLREDIPGLMFWNTFMWGLFYAFEEIVRSTSIHSGAWRCRSRRKAFETFSWTQKAGRSSNSDGRRGLLLGQRVSH